VTSSKAWYLVTTVANLCQPHAGKDFGETFLTQTSGDTSGGSGLQHGIETPLWQATDVAWQSNKLLGDSQWGSRPHRSTIDVLIQKELTYDLIRRRHYTAGLFDNAAASCYDRIVRPLTTLVDLSFGAAPTITALHEETIRKMRYKLETKLGVSNRSYQHSERTPIHGIERGTCDSPGKWCFTSELLARILEAEATPACR